MDLIDQLVLCSREAQHEALIHTSLLKQAVELLPSVMQVDDKTNEGLDKIEAIIFNIRRPLRAREAAKPRRPEQSTASQASPQPTQSRPLTILDIL